MNEHTFCVIFQVCIYSMFIKAVTIGSSFDFYQWAKYGKEYTTWYANRPKFEHKEAEK